MGGDGQTDDAEVLRSSFGQQSGIGRTSTLRTRAVTHPMVYDRTTDRYMRDSWDEALAKIGAALLRCRIPIAEFYTSGRHPMRRLFSISCLRGNTGTTTFPTLEHVPRGDERRPARVNWRRQGNSDLEDFDDLRRAPLYRP